MAKNLYHDMEDSRNCRSQNNGQNSSKDSSKDCGRNGSQR